MLFVKRFEVLKVRFIIFRIPLHTCEIGFVASKMILSFFCLSQRRIQHNCAAQLAGRWRQINCNSLQWGKNILYWADSSCQGKKKFSCIGTTSPTNHPRNDPSFVLFESPFTSVSTVSSSHPSPVSLVSAPMLRIRIRDPLPFWRLDPGSGIGFFRIPDLGSRIPNPYFWELSDNFSGKKFYNS